MGSINQMFLSKQCVPVKTIYFQVNDYISLCREMIITTQTITDLLFFSVFVCTYVCNSDYIIVVSHNWNF